MPNQRDIARVLGVNQATVSLALRGDPSVSRQMQRRVKETADRLGYRPNAYVSSLMAHIRSGRKPSEEGVIGILVEAKSLAEWHRVESYKIFHEGASARAEELGFRVECFCLRAPGMSPRTIDRILEARGIQGIILAAPYRGNRALNIRWERYASVGVGHGWEPQQLDRVANDQPQNLRMAFSELGRLGYQRIGTLLSESAAVGDRGLRWLTGYLEAQHHLPPDHRIPMYSGNFEAGGKKFNDWYTAWKPDALLTITGWEVPTLRSLGLRFPDDAGLASLVRPHNSEMAGIDEKNEIVGQAAVELVAARLSRNELGIPGHPRLTLIDGRWVGGPTAVSQSHTHRDEKSGDCPGKCSRAVSSV